MMKRKTKLPIWSYFNTVQRALLTETAQPIHVSGIGQPTMQKLIDDMLITMKQAKGIGLAAPQIGQSIRLAVISGEIDERVEPYVLINPVLQVAGTTQVEGEEGCLSIPGVFGMVPRAATISLKAFDRLGQPWSMDAHELLARVIQHEVDHLNGVLFLERLTTYTKGQEKIS